MNTPFRCHDADACAMGQNACPTPSICGCAVPACAVKDGTHKPSGAVRQIGEPSGSGAQIYEGAAQQLELLSADGSMGHAIDVRRDICRNGASAIRAQATELSTLSARMIDQEETHMRELTAYRTTVQNLKARLAEESARTAAEKLRADQMSAQHDTQAALNREARAELAEMKAKAQGVAGIEFGMRGKNMTFQIGIQRFTLAYEPEEEGEFEFMQDMLTKAISSITNGVKMGCDYAAPSPAVPAPQAALAAVPDGYALVQVEKINQAIQRATVFDDGGDGADPESARSVVAILREAMAAQAPMSVEGGSE